MSLSFCDYHIAAFLKSQDEKLPLDLQLSRYFRAHKSLGSKDRKAVGEALYKIARYKTLLQDGAYKKLEERLETASEWDRLGISKFLFDKLIQVYGPEKGREVARILNTEAPVTIRKNPAKPFSFPFPTVPCKKAPYGLMLQKREPLFATPEFKAGLFEVQDEGSQLVADLVKPKPGEHVLDYCSGSGGKTLAFAHYTQGKGQIYLHDNRPHILLEARKRLKRAGVQNAQFCLPKFPVDWVLADVPCSGTGTLRRNPDAKWKIDQAMIDRLVLEQKKIVAEAIKFLKPSGTFVYATCSILPEENHTHFEGLELVETLSLLPEEGGMDGFFAAVFKKKNVIS